MSRLRSRFFRFPVPQSFRRLLLLVFLLVLARCGYGGLPLLAPDSRVERAVAGLSEERTARSAEQALQRLARDRNEDAQAAACAALAAHWRRSGRRDRASALVKPWSDLKPGNLVLNRIEALFEHALCEAEGGHPLSAFRILDYAREHATGLEAAYTRVAYAAVVELAHDYEKALDWLREALALGNRWANPPRRDEYERPEPPPGTGRWPPLRTEIERRVKALEYKRDVARWGLEFVLYRDAQNARKADHVQALDFTDTARLYPGQGAGRADIPEADHRRALELYDRLIEEGPETVFAEAAGLYRAVSLAHLGRAAEAERDLKQFVSSAPLGLYRGEAMLLLGDIALQTHWAPRSAGQHYREALDWCERARAVSEGVRLYAVPDKASAPSRAPERWQTLDRGGVIVRERLPAAAVVNRLTAPWYLDRLQAELRFRLGFLEALAGDWDAAREHWRRVAEHDAQLRVARQRRYHNALGRLEGSADKRFFIGTAEDNVRVPDRVKPALWWADFLFLLERFDEADSLYRRLRDAALARGDAAVGARAGLGRVFALGEKARCPDTARVWLPRARRVGRETLDRFPQAPAAPYIAFMIGHSWDNGARGDYAEARAAYRVVYTRYPRSRHAEPARFYEIFKGYQFGEPDAMLGLIADFRRVHPKSGYLQVFDGFERTIRERMEP